jgi:hypothetical protein|tara:strand:+ start:177 stop:506 length:330 start_codon:yes stop_codon:yes gene_type:complete
MKNDLFDTEKKREAAIVIFKTGINTEFWKLMIQILEANIEFVTEQILNGGEDTTKERMDRLRDRLRVYKEMIGTPASMVKKLTASEGEEPDVDPYFTKEQLKEERKKVN